MKALPLLAALALCPAVALAGTCENNFTSQGDPRNGAEYRTSTVVEGVGVGSALAQLRVIAQGNKYKYLNETGDARSGTLTMEYPRALGYEAFPVAFTATARDGGAELSVHTRTSRGTNFKDAESRAHLCGLLAQVKSGARGDALAASVRKAEGAGTSQVVQIAPRKLSDEIEKQIRNSLRGPGASPQIINERYKGRRYRIDGQLYTKETDTYGPRPNSHGRQVTFDIVKKGGLIRAAEVGVVAHTHTQIVCELARGQEGYADRLESGDYMTLTGTFRIYEGGQFILTGCRPD
ncbi:hypothetical protein [Lysobacter enzymogenes]|uniref:hypothetical protein n=1 Tax=Lysobacter enzymogenes TaxID=69 RepID=UPI001AF4B3D2|nr:hypothetical protein [Lysobacter enzymogenes]QQQ00410.1 hypothetical protein JHW41_20340 [Lysobacter enzymogenes]